MGNRGGGGPRGRDRIAELPQLYTTGSEERASVELPSSGRQPVHDAPITPVDARYSVGEMIGEGGMGKVFASHDGVVGRDIAIKYLAKHATWAKDRFFREARVQGQLEHPSVVPVYDLGVSEQGDAFFTMKRIVGKTLDEILDGIRAGDAEVRAKFTRRRMLSALAQVSLALAFAHSRGVVHRDIKPGNIMFGDYGEVYLLDWGISKVEARRAREGETEPTPSIRDTPAIEETMQGAVLGSPGYMAPEQARGLANAADPRTDIYSLGLVLYEVLTLRRAHDGDSRNELFQSTLAMDGASPAELVSDVPKGLDALCRWATRLDPEERLSDARRFYDVIEGHLDEEREIEQRSTLADKHADAAAAIRKRIAKAAPEKAERLRGDAMRELGAALVLSPMHEAAQAALFEMLVEDPDTLPRSAERELEKRRRETVRVVFGRMKMAYLPWFGIVPMAYAMGVRHPVFLLVVTATAGALVGLLAKLSGEPRPKIEHAYLAYGLNFVLVAMLAGFFGPLMVVPQAALAVAINAVFTLRLGPRGRLVVSAAALATVLVPLALGLLGLVPSAYTVTGGELVVRSGAVTFTPVLTSVLLVVMSLVPLQSPTRVLGSALEAVGDAERKSVARAHRLRSYLPLLDEARESTTSRKSRVTVPPRASRASTTAERRAPKDRGEG